MAFELRIKWNQCFQIGGIQRRQADMSEPTMNDNDMLDALLTALEPFAIEAGAVKESARWTGTVRILPLAAERALYVTDDAGDERQLRTEKGTPELAEVVALFLTACLNKLPEAKRDKVRLDLAGGQVQAIVSVDIVAGGTASGVLIPTDESSTLDPEVLYTFRRKETLH